MKRNERRRRVSYSMLFHSGSMTEIIVVCLKIRNSQKSSYLGGILHHRGIER